MRSDQCVHLICMDMQIRVTLCFCAFVCFIKTKTRKSLLLTNSGNHDNFSAVGDILVSKDGRGRVYRHGKAKCFTRKKRDILQLI